MHPGPSHHQLSSLGGLRVAHGGLLVTSVSQTNTSPRCIHTITRGQMTFFEGRYRQPGLYIINSLPECSSLLYGLSHRTQVVKLSPCYPWTDAENEFTLETKVPSVRLAPAQETWELWPCHRSQSFLHLSSINAFVKSWSKSPLTDICRRGST